MPFPARDEAENRNYLRSYRQLKKVWYNSPQKITFEGDGVMSVLEELDPSLRDVVKQAVQFRFRAIEGVLELLSRILQRREIVPQESSVTVTYTAENFIVLRYDGGFFTASFLYSESDVARHITVLEAEHISPLVTGVVVIPDRQFVQRVQS
jgi:hypothetical protein